MERARKAMEAASEAHNEGRPVLIDIHQGNGGSCKGPGMWSVPLVYMQHLPWADRTWFGEGYDYWGQSAEWWLLETSGIPYGLTGDMIR